MLVVLPPQSRLLEGADTYTQRAIPDLSYQDPRTFRARLPKCHCIDFGEAPELAVILASDHLPPCVPFSQQHGQADTSSTPRRYPARSRVSKACYIARTGKVTEAWK